VDRDSAGQISGLDHETEHMHQIETLMHIAIEEARISLREGNSGFGAVITKGRDVISKAHDTDKTSGDPTQHAEIPKLRFSRNYDKLRPYSNYCEEMIILDA